jgi:hypothetical protein
MAKSVIISICTDAGCGCGGECDNSFVFGEARNNQALADRYKNCHESGSGAIVLTSCSGASSNVHFSAGDSTVCGLSAGGRGDVSTDVSDVTCASCFVELCFQVEGGGSEMERYEHYKAALERLHAIRSLTLFMALKEDPGD